MKTKGIAVLSCMAMIILITTITSCRSHKAIVKQEVNKDMALGTPPDGEGSDTAQNGMPPGPPPDGKDPQGMPPGGKQNGKPGERPQGMPPGGMGGQRFDASSILSVVTVKEGTESKTNETITASQKNQSAVAAYTGSSVTLENNKINTTGNTSSDESSSFQGLNAAVLGRDQSVIRMKANTINTSGSGANGVFAYGKSKIYSENDVITCTGNGGHGLMASGGGTIVGSNVNINTAGTNSGAVATDRGSGIITVAKGKIITTGKDSPGIYSTGKVSISDAEIESTGSEVAVIEGSNSIILSNSNLLVTVPNKWGVMIYQSFSGDAEGADGRFEMKNGSLKYTASTGPLFFVTNSTAYITLKNVEISCTSATLVNAMSSRWGNAGSNGGNVNLMTESQHLNGNLIADENSKIKLSLMNNSDLEGAINSDNKAKSISVNLDGSSTWTLTADSHISTLIADMSNNSVSNITGNGHSLYYKASENKALNGKTFALGDGGFLKPE